MTATRTVESWLAALADAPLDAGLWQEFAVWLQDEQDDLEAAAWARWCGEARRCPWYSPPNFGTTRWGWWDWTIADEEDCSEIPEALRRHLGGYTGLRNGSHLYCTYTAAMLDLLRAWRLARAEGWSPAPPDVASDDTPARE